MENRIFEIKEGTMEFGIGHHGEPGIKVEPLSDAKGMVAEMVPLVCDDIPYQEGDEVVVLVSRVRSYTGYGTIYLF